MINTSFLPRASRLFLATLSLLCISTVRADVLETFDNDLGAFDGSFQNTGTASGNDFGFSNTSNAGGDAGEVGGVFVRTRFTGPNVGWIGDTTLFTTYGSDDDFRFSGQVRIVENNGFNSAIGIGFFERDNVGVGGSTSAFVGLQLQEPGNIGGTATAPNYRASLRAFGSVTSGDNRVQVPFNEVIEFEFAYDHEANIFSGTIGDQNLSINAFSISPRALDTFGIVGTIAENDNFSQQTTVFFDNLSYSTAVPEPSSLALFGLFTTAGVLRRKRRC